MQISLFSMHDEIRLSCHDFMIFFLHLRFWLKEIYKIFNLKMQGHSYTCFQKYINLVKDIIFYLEYHIKQE